MQGLWRMPSNPLGRLSPGLILDILDLNAYFALIQITSLETGRWQPIIVVYRASITQRKVPVMGG
jgi:hypothetical protein